MLDVIAFHARRTPQALAIVDAHGIEFSYLECYHQVVAVAARLRTEFPGAMSAGPVAAFCRDKRHNLIVLLALEALGVSCLPFVLPLDPGFDQALRYCHLIVCDEALDIGGVPQCLIDATWFDQSASTIDIGEFKPGRFAPSQPVVIFTTSGSTGPAKCIPIDQPALNFRETNRFWQYAYTASSRYLIGPPVSISSVYIGMRAVFWCGGALVYWPAPSADEGTEALARVIQQATHSTLLPGQLNTLLDAVPACSARIEPLQLYSIGAPLDSALASRVAAHLGAVIKDSYGLNEIGGCMWVGPNGVGDVLPGIEIEVIDAAARPVSQGEPGLLRIRSPGMAHGYLDPAQSAERFVDGWFVTSDRAVQLSAGRIRLMGRADRMMNLGGIKVMPESVESLLVAKAIASDVAACSVAGPDGVERLYIAVSGTSLDDGTLIQRVSQTLQGGNFGQVQIVRLDRIPRSAQGKIQRALLSEELTKRYGKAS